MIASLNKLPWCTTLVKPGSKIPTIFMHMKISWMNLRAVGGQPIDTNTASDDKEVIIGEITDLLSRLMQR